MVGPIVTETTVIARMMHPATPKGSTDRVLQPSHQMVLLVCWWRSFTIGATLVDCYLCRAVDVPEEEADLDAPLLDDGTPRTLICVHLPFTG